MKQDGKEQKKEEEVAMAVEKAMAEAKEMARRKNLKLASLSPPIPQRVLVQWSRTAKLSLGREGY